MALKIAIQRDEVVHRNGERQSYSKRWIELAPDFDVEAIPVDVTSPSIVEALSGFDGFMWRCDPSAHARLYANRLLYALEKGLGIPVFPSLGSRWHFEDKVGQFYFFVAAGIPTPATTICWSR